LNNQVPEKLCVKCGVTKFINEFRKWRSECRLCEAVYGKSKYVGDRTCTNCLIFKTENEFHKNAKHCKECAASKKREKIIKMRINLDQSEYNNFLNLHSENGKKFYKKKENKFDSVPIEQCYEDFLNVLRKNANSRATGKKNYNLDLEFLVELYKSQDGKCALTGISFKLEKYGNKRAFAPSIDRLNCSKGYTKDNVRLVCLVVNLALNDFGDQIFDTMCREYVKNKLTNQ